jgi:hypothetical protein
VVELTAREPFTYHVAASDPLGAVLSYSAKNLPAGAKFEEATGVLAWTPEQVNYGSNLVTFTVSNESFAVSKTVDFKVKLYLIPSESYTQGSYYLYMKEVERIESEMNEPDADKTKLAAELAQAEGALVPLSEHAEQISVTESMVTASHRSWDKRYNAAQNGWHAMDGNTSTFTDTERNPGWILVDLGEDNEQTVGSFKLYPRTNYQSRMNGAVIQGSNDGTNFDDLYTVSGITGNGWYTFVIDNNTTAYRYLRLYSSNGNANAAEIEYYKIDNTLIPILLEEAEAIDTELYTEESVQPLQAAVSNAESVYTNADASQEEIDAASASLLAALQGLQWKDITAAVEPVEPNGNNGWYTSPVTVTLSPAKIAEYSLDGGSSWTAFSEPVTLSEEGVHQVLYRRSVDTGETESLEFKIDLTAPQVTVTGDTYYTIDQEIVITCSTTDETSSVYGTPCDQPLIQVKAYTLASGENTATVTVEDMAGHQKTVTHTFTVAVTFDSLKNVTNAFLQETGAKAWESVAESYNNKLDLAKEKAKSGKIEAARGIIDGFIDQVTDQTGNFFTKEQSDILIRWAQIVI